MADYFKHYSNMRNTPKVQKLREEMGAKGYGIYLMVVELSCDNLERDYESIAADIHEDVEDVRRVIEDYDLFEIKES